MDTTYQPNSSSNYEYYDDEIKFAVVNQPSFSGHSRQSCNTNYPRGLEILNDLTTIVVREIAPFFCSCENNKIYEILYQGTKIFSVQEETDFWTYCCYAEKRPFKIVLYDMKGNALMSVFRSSVRSHNFVQVKAAGRIIGSIQNHLTWCKPKLSVQDANGVTLFKIKRSICLPFCFWSEIDFIILDMDGVEVGKITRHWSGSCAAVCNSADTFSIKFPKDVDLSSKALLIGACFLIDFKNFEPQSGSSV